MAGSTGKPSSPQGCKEDGNTCCVGLNGASCFLPASFLLPACLPACVVLPTYPSQVHEEEWSYIPVGGPLPIKQQPLTAFGAAANLVHPATGFSVSR